MNWSLTVFGAYIYVLDCTNNSNTLHSKRRNSAYNFNNCPHVIPQERLTDNIAENLAGAQEFLQKRAVANFAAVDATYGRMVQQKIERINASNKRDAGPSKCPHGYGRSNL